MNQIIIRNNEYFLTITAQVDIVTRHYSQVNKSLYDVKTLSTALYTMGYIESQNRNFCFDCYVGSARNRGRERERVYTEKIPLDDDGAAGVAEQFLVIY